MPSSISTNYGGYYTPRAPALTPSYGSYGGTGGVGTPNKGAVQQRHEASLQEITSEADFDRAQQAGNLGFERSRILGADQGEQARQQLELQAKLQADAEARRFGYFSGSGAGASPAVGAPGLEGVDEGAARAAAFGRAKDQAGKIARASLSSLQEQMASRGISGSGIEAMRTAGVVSGAEAPLQELTREQLIQDLNRAAELKDMGYQGALTQRGQDIAGRQSLMGLVTSRLY